MYVGDPIGINGSIWHVRWRPYRLYMFLYYMYVSDPIGINGSIWHVRWQPYRYNFLDRKKGC